MSFRQAYRWLPALIVVTLSGCAAVGPDYVTPTLSAKDVPARWTSPTDTAAEHGPGALAHVHPARWWSDLSDPALDRLVGEALAGSPTVEAATAKLRQVRAAYVQTAAAASPSVDGGAGATQAVGDAGGQRYSESWLSMNSAWEIDLFGAVRRGKEGALAREAAQLASLADTQVSLAADVADAYLGYRACQSHVALSEQDVASREATAQLTAASVETGFTAPYQGIRSAASVAEAKTQLAATRSQCGRLENLLTRLTGVARPALMAILAEKPTGLDRLPVPRHFDIAIPGDALVRRPDIRAAERRLAAASADIGLAEADRYPRLALNGSLGYSVTGGGSSGGLSFGTWSFGPSLSLPIFDGGRRAAAVEQARSRYDEALAEFRLRARAAIQEVEDALTRYAAAHERAENARVSAAQYQSYFDAVEIRYREGASNLLELEDARRAMLGAQQTLLAVQQERLQAWVALHRSTGGAAAHDPPAAASPGPVAAREAQAN
ncbi:efflux transporter outer membrane subunit [Azonexus sp.]|uniref:efflux transporter outer membrane subunit n=2 Tax=Azonexus sp. TaxID=1872668 RepID=UPI0035AE364D